MVMGESISGAASAAVVNPYGVKVGQVWRDWDVRYRMRPGFNMQVIEVGDTHAIVRKEDRRKTRIRLDRFKPNSTGYLLVKDVG